MIKGFFYSLRQAFKQLFRNKGMSFASIFSITARMIILALFLFLSININYLTENVKDQFGTMCQTTLGEVLLFAAGKNITAKDKNDIPYISCLDDATMSVMTMPTLASPRSV